MNYRFITPLLLASLLLTACGGSTTGTDTPETQNNPQTETAAVDTEPARTPHAVDTDALDFGGAELNQVPLAFPTRKYN